MDGASIVFLFSIWKGLGTSVVIESIIKNNNDLGD
jgi:hypothetical protein